MNGPNVFAAPARRLFLVVCRSKRTAGERGGIANWMKRFEGGRFVLADISRPGIDRFLRCRKEWAEENGLEVALVDPMKNDEFKAELDEEYGIQARPTDFGLDDLKFECGDEVILAMPRPVVKKGRREADSSFSGRYSLRAVRFGCESCMPKPAGGEVPDMAALLAAIRSGKPLGGGRLPNPASILALLNGRAPPADNSPKVRITIEFPVQDVLRFFGGFLGGMMSGPAGDQPSD